MYSDLAKINFSTSYRRPWVGGGEHFRLKTPPKSAFKQIPKFPLELSQKIPQKQTPKDSK